MKYSLIFVLTCSILFFSCKKAATEDNNCSSIINSGILAVTSTTLTGNVNQEINLEVLYGIGNGCGISSEMESIKEGNSIAINMITKFEGCICTQVYFEKTKIYIFKSAIAGNFKLKFNKGNNTFIEKDVVIQ